MAKGKYKVIAHSPWFRALHLKTVFRFVVGERQAGEVKPFATAAQFSCGRLSYCHQHETEALAAEFFMAECASVSGQFGVQFSHERPAEVGKCIGRFEVRA
jgi:hypothetical protein